jgi:hypothetical protein
MSDDEALADLLNDSSGSDMEPISDRVDRRETPSEVLVVLLPGGHDQNGNTRDFGSCPNNPRLREAVKRFP